MQPPPMDSPPAAAPISVRRERLAWFVGGAGTAALVGALLGPALAQSGGTNPGGNNPQQPPQSQVPRPIPMTSSGVTGDSNNRMIAVTGNDITGQSVLYLVDTVGRQLAVYQASGGAPGTQSLKLVGARNIDLDLQLDGFNDKTTADGKPLTYKDLEGRFKTEVDGQR